MADLSLRDAYQHVVRSDDTSGVISFNAFFLRPQGVRHAISMMVPAPTSYRLAHREFFRDDTAWTEEAQGITVVGGYFLFVSGGSKGGLGRAPAAVHIMDSNANIRTVVLAEAEGTTGPKFRSLLAPVGGAGEPVDFHHIGHIIADGETLYVDHFDSMGNAHILVLNNPDLQGNLSFNRWTPLQPVGGLRVGMVAFDPILQCFITADGNSAVSELFLHDMAGRVKGHQLNLQDTGDYNVDLPWYKGYIQGGALSSRGHLFVASGRSGITPFQPIRVFSVLTGRLYSEIPVMTEGQQELEGICLAEATVDSLLTQLQVVLLENELSEKDDMYWKSYAAAQPDRV